MYLDLRDLADEAAEATGDDLDALRELAYQLSSLPTGSAEDVAIALADAAENEPTMILESQFEDYARELAEDIGALLDDAGWPAYCIDWERAARDLSMDYTLVTYAGYHYYIRL